MSADTANAYTGPVVIDDSNGIKTIVDYREDEEGRRVKITRKVRAVLSKHKAKHAVAERKQLAKFGAASQWPNSFDDGLTSLGEEVFLKLAVNKNHDVEEQELTVSEKVKKLQSSKIICRVCKGDHWTTKCPYKDTIGDTFAAKPEAPAAAASVGAGGAPTSGKYIPPSMRARMEASAAGGAEPSAGSSWRGDRDETQNVRVTNLSEDAEEQDLHALFKRFGPIQRIYIARDRETDLCKGFAFISFYNRDDGAKAIEVMNGYGFDNLILNVSWAAPK